MKEMHIDSSSFLSIYAREDKLAINQNQSRQYINMYNLRFQNNWVIHLFFSHSIYINSEKAIIGQCAF